jgi:nucleoside-diphosphate-sugar epimerase
MRICVIGGTGHIGRFLTPRLVRGGHEVTVIASGRTPVPGGPEWAKVAFRQGRYPATDAEWSQLTAGLAPEVAVDILGGDIGGLRWAVRGSCRHLIVCGSVWMLGQARVVPTPPVAQGPCEFAGYAKRFQEMLETKETARRQGLAFTAVMPPNICGPGKIPLDAVGGRSLENHRAMRAGRPQILPEGCNTLIGPADAEDIASIFALAVEQRDRAADAIFNAGSAYALSAPDFIAAYGRIYRTEIPIETIPWKEFLAEFMPDPGASFHYRAHMCPDISQTRARLGYEPRYTPEATMERAVEWMRDEKLI